LDNFEDIEDFIRKEGGSMDDDEALYWEEDEAIKERRK